MDENGIAKHIAKRLREEGFISSQFDSEHGAPLLIASELRSALPEAPPPGLSKFYCLTCDTVFATNSTFTCHCQKDNEIVLLSPDLIRDYQRAWEQKVAKPEAPSELALLKGAKDHPEHYCHRCGGRNIGWYADSDLWNQFDPPESIICPICFVIEAEAGGIVPPAWRVAPEWHADEKGRLLERLHDLREENHRLKNTIEVLEDSDQVRAIAAGLKDIQEGHTKPIEQIRRELAQSPAPQPDLDAAEGFEQWRLAHFNSTRFDGHTEHLLEDAWKASLRRLRTDHLGRRITVEDEKMDAPRRTKHREEPAAGD